MNSVVFPVASVASAVAVASPSIAASAVVDGETLRILDRHRASTLRQMIAGRVRSRTVDARWSPEYDEAKVAAATAAQHAAQDALNDAHDDLLNAQPVTIDGIIALIDYVEAFNTGSLKHPTDPEWVSGPYLWPGDTFDDDADTQRFAFDLLLTVRSALKKLAL